MTAPRSVGLLLTEATARLRGAGVDSAEHDARALLAVAADRAPYELSRVDEIDSATADRFAELISQRALRVPLQHLTGRAYFRHLELAVGPGVFVPRPETEVMAGWAIEWLCALTTGRGRPLVVDLGTGSGAIALAIAAEVPGAQVHAVEMSEDAAAWAARNLAGSEVLLHVEDMASALPELDGTVDLVAANPPYIPLDAYASVTPEARDHDPTAALFSGADGLDAIRVVAQTAARLLRPSGLLCVEHAEVQADSAPAVLLGHGGFDSVRDHLDLSGRPRFVTAVRRSIPLAGLAE